MCDKCKTDYNDRPLNEKLEKVYECLSKEAEKAKGKEYNEKYLKTMENSNKMLEECLSSNPEKLKPGAAKEILKAIDENKKSMEMVCEEKAEKKKPVPLKYDTVDTADMVELNTNNRFIIEINGQIFNPDPHCVCGMVHDAWHRLVVDMYEPTTVCLPLILETSAEKNMRYTINKNILGPDNEVLYTTTYRACTVVDWEESPLSYHDCSPRIFRITFDYTGHTHETK